MLHVVVHILQVATEITALRERLAAEVTRERSLARVLPKVIAQVARLLEDGATTFIHAPKEKLDALCILVADLDCLMQVLWNGREGA